MKLTTMELIQSVDSGKFKVKILLCQSKATKNNYQICRICFTRAFWVYLWSYYIPSGLFVSVSWVSFLIPADSIPGRMSLLVTMVLVLVNIFSDLLVSQPRTTLTAMSAWFFTCIFFVFGALVAYAGGYKNINNERAITTPDNTFLMLRPSFEESAIQQEKVLRCQKCDICFLSGRDETRAGHCDAGLEVSVHLSILVYGIQFCLLDNCVLQKICVN